MALHQLAKQQAAGILKKSIMLADRSHMVIEASLSRFELAKVLCEHGEKRAGTREISRAMSACKAVNFRSWYGGIDHSLNRAK
jgi:hypothetical protein